MIIVHNPRMFADDEYGTGAKVTHNRQRLKILGLFFVA